MKVLYIAGFSRCGSTLLGSMLGQLEGFFNLGEARMIWQRSLIDNRHCGCGVSFSECATWRSIIGEFSSDHPVREVEPLAAMVRNIARTRALPIRSRSLTARNRVIGKVAELREAVTSLYATVQSTSGARVLVDTSKVPMYGRLLRDSGLDVRVVHLVRDPRAVAQSRIVPKQHVDRQASMGGVSVLNTAVSWNVVNQSIERLLADSSYHRIGYRNLIEEPATVLNALAAFMDETAHPDDWLSGNMARLEATHSVYGNPGRFNSGEVNLVMDERWRSLPTWKALLVNAATVRARRRYGDLL